mgnify:CR=1 FL=1
MNLNLGIQDKLTEMNQYSAQMVMYHWENMYEYIIICEIFSNLLHFF